LFFFKKKLLVLIYAKIFYKSLLVVDAEAFLAKAAILPAAVES